MPTASSCSPMKTLPAFSLRSSSASSLCVRTTVSIPGLTVRAASIICRARKASGIAITSMRARAMCAWRAPPDRRRHRRPPARPARAALDQLAVLLHHHEWQPTLGERLADPATHPSVPREDDLTCGTLWRRCGRQGRQRIGPALEPAREARPPLQPALRGLDGLEHDRSRDGDDGAGQEKILPFHRQQPSVTPRPARMKENSPICARLADTVSAVSSG